MFPLSSFFKNKTKLQVISARFTWILKKSLDYSTFHGLKRISV